MPTYSKQIGSSTTLGRKIKLTAIAIGSAQTLHTVPATPAAGLDEIWVWAMNHSATAQCGVNICFGGTPTDPDDVVPRVLDPGEGAVLIIPGWPLGAGQVVKAYAQTTSLVTVAIFANRITP